ncbi:MAG TPA: LysE family translocator [Ottowia sp.]|nr:LysE family translocator [Ottowia sp.]
MPDLHTLLLFIAAGLLLNLTPGPDVLFVSANAMRAGARAGVVAALGIAAGCLVHVGAAALGVSALLAASSTAFGVLKWLGALYLGWVGVQMLRSAVRRGAIETRAARAQPMGVGSPFDSKLPLTTVLRRGFLTNVLNPKVALFFLAFVPQFITPGTAHTGGGFLALGLIFTANGLLVSIGWALAAAWLGGRTQALARVTRWMDGVAGAVFIAFGVKLALTEAPAA